MENWRIIVRGKVQGVFYRKFAHKQALAFGLSGFVQNRIDGTVLIEASGEREDLESFVFWCRKGSPLSRVEAVDIEAIDRTYALDDFLIL